MESMGIPNSPSGLELTIAIPASRNGVHISSSFGSDGNKGFNIENTRELALLDTFNREEVDAYLTYSMEIEGKEDRRPAGRLSILQRKYNRLSWEQSDLLEASFQKNHFPDKGTRQALADTLKVTVKKVRVWFVNRRSRFKKHKLEQNEKELDRYKRQVESLASETHHLRCKLKKLKKKFNKLKLKQAPSTAPPPPPPITSEEEQQQQKQVIYVPILAGLFNNGKQNVATTTDSFITQQGSVSATASLPVTNVLLLPSSGGSSI